MLMQIVIRTNLFASLCIAVFGCSTSDPEPVVPEGPAAAFHGVWKGQYKKMDDEGLTLKETRAKAQFTAEDENNGTFDFRFPEEDDAKVTGSYQVFNETVLLFEIKESSYSELGMPGSVRSMKFELSGSALMLENNDIEIIFLRDEDGTLDNSADPNDEDTGEAKPVDSQWQCVDRTRNTWSLSIATDVFSANISGTGNTFIVISGDVEDANTSRSKATLVVNSASIDVYSGRYMSVERIGNDLQVVLYSPDGVNLDSFTCAKS